MTVSAGRSVHGVPRQVRKHAADPVLRVDGLVARPLALTPSDLAGLPRVPYVGSLRCIEGGNVPETDWSGVDLAELMALAEPPPEAHFVRVCAGHYAVPVSLDDSRNALLCDQLSGESLAPEHGRPWRLVVPGNRYYTSVKSVDRLEVTAELPDNSAERIAQVRSRARNAKRGKSSAPEPTETLSAKASTPTTSSDRT